MSGRGRGSSRGRGRGGRVASGGRGGRGRGRSRGRCRGGNSRIAQQQQISSTSVSAPGGANSNFTVTNQASLTFIPPDPFTYNWETVRLLLLNSDSSINHHTHVYQYASSLYIEHIQSFINNGMILSFSVTQKARILATLLNSNNKSAIHMVLTHSSFINLSEMLKAIQLLDSKRQLRALQKKLTILEKQKTAYLAEHVTNGNDSIATDNIETTTSIQVTNSSNPAPATSTDIPTASVTTTRITITPKKGPTARVKEKTIGQLRNKIENVSKEIMLDGSFSGAKQKLVQTWCRSIPASKLEFFLLNFPPIHWQELADLVHLSTKDFQLPYFVSCLYGGSAPDDSVVALAQSATPTNLHEIISKQPLLANCYSYFRNKFKEHRRLKEEMEASVKELMKMGFTYKQAVIARQVHPNNTQMCVEYILENEAAIDARAMPDLSSMADTSINTEAKELLAKLAPLETLIWFYEELASPVVEESITQRLKNGETLEQQQGEATIQSRCNYGKLMERLLYALEQKLLFAPLLIPLAESKLQEMSQLLGSKQSAAKVAVLGDCSGSMEVAIKCASTLSSLLSVALNADLLFFHETSFTPAVIPRTATQAIEVITKTVAHGSTSMASALYPYYERKEKVDLFILVSDEQENREYKGYMFAELFREYRETVHSDAKVILVSFLRVGEEGVIKQRMNAIQLDVQQFRLDPERPDTSKFDALLGLCSCETASIAYKRKTIMNVLEMECNLPTALADLLLKY